MNEKWIVDLSTEEREKLLHLTSAGTTLARTIKRAQILLLADEGLPDDKIVSASHGSLSTVLRTKRRFVELGLDRAINDDPRPGGERKLDGKQEALLVALACSKPPTGHSRWTLQLLAGRFVELAEVEGLSDETVRRRLKEKEIKPWQKKMWCIPKFDADFVARMEHILDLYAEPPDPNRPVVNFDEALKQLVAETRQPIPAAPGKPERYDYEYRRTGTANIFLFFDRHRGWRKAVATQCKGNVDFAERMRELVDDHYPHAETIRVVLDNLSTHREGALYKAFPPAEARRILRRLEFHYTPKHASWLNMVEIEIGTMNRQCLDRRVPDFDTLRAELKEWETARNEQRATIQWLFDVDRARSKLTRAYPAPESVKTPVAQY